MGTSWSVKAVGGAAALAGGIQHVLDGVVDEMSHWEPASDMGRFNRSTPGSWQPLPPAFSRVLSAALAIADASDGAFDPAMGTLANLWGFGPAGARNTIPDAGEIAQALASSGRHRIDHDPALIRARRTAPAQLDFSGIAKGYAVDAVATYLLAQGVLDFLVEVGGELRGAGIKPDGHPWWVDLEMPYGAAFAPVRLALQDLAVATSGDYLRYFVHDGQHFSHTLDPRTGRPIANGVVSVTVIHRECMMADAWATALTVLGPNGMAIAEREGLTVQMIVREGDGFAEYLSPTMRAMFE
jgi:thiamine biosynthesis lipoprotein